MAARQVRAAARVTLTRLGACLALALLAACDLPRDPAGTLDRVTGGTLRVGMVTAENAAVPGHAAMARADRDLVEGLARDLRASPVWTHASTEALFLALERREIDLVAGGVYADTPWAGRIGLSNPVGPHAGEPDAERLLAVPPGENRWLLAINRFIARRETKP
jgi:polar amino acid transport system substrate-binding protein